jgi:uncharacterized membrane protein
MTGLAVPRPVDAAAAPALQPRTRVQALDILRGLVIALMALDHVRDYFHASGYAYDPLDPARTTALIYVTRWVTHFCAPTFVFLAGVSAWLQGAKGKDRAQLSRFLVTRGVWLAVLEVTVVAFGWSFSIPLLPHLQVIWAIGCSMIVLGALVWLPSAAVLAVGIAIVAGHNLLDATHAPQMGSFATLWQLLFENGMVTWNGRPVLAIYYAIVPWLGVMALGYGLGPVFLSPRRDRVLVSLGAALMAAFVVLRFLNGYGDPLPWSAQPTPGQTAMSFFNVQKYPPSLSYVCATLGPMLLLVPLFDRARGPLVQVFRTYGAVPLMAYVAHLYVMHALAIAAHAAAGQSTAGLFNTIANFMLHPEVFGNTGFSLPVVYAAWLTVLALIYPLCRWWAGVKQRRRDWWISYL